MLETVGRRSGGKRCTAVLFLRGDPALVVMAANAGANRTPAWWLNLEHAGEGVAMLGRSRIRVRSRELAGGEREARWRAFVDRYPQADHHRRFTDRELPLIALAPIGT